MIQPLFFRKFNCLADRCRHSCCKGWEIDIDSNTAEYYKELPGEIGEEVRRNIFFDEEGCHFKLQEERCPFLQQDGLCRLIREMGEDVLCDICALHPRFFFELGEYEFAGLGLCCENVCELLMEGEGELLFLEEEEEILPPMNEEEFSELENPAKETPGMPETMTLTQLLEALQLPVTKEELRFTPNPDANYYAKLLEVYQSLEPIDENWTKEMETLKSMLPRLPELAEEHRKEYPRDVYQRVFSYILYRQLEQMEDNDHPVTEECQRKMMKKLIFYARTSADFIFLTDALWGDTKERIRRWSEQVEYSTENVEILSNVM